MTTFQIAGFIIFIGGMVPYAIGSLIHIAHNPEALDLSFRVNPWPSWPYGWVELTHPKSRWWCGIGFPTCLAGFILLLVSTIPLGDLALYTALFGAFFGLHELIARRRR
ncbi:hypothetical protein NKI56_20765 [Mesorhizobium sp. M0622]|uniref:hypothetical protein n=1 Tax=unclassified Mesorhizobium TaxID=325217 RepID=UPI003334D12D